MIYFLQKHDMSFFLLSFQTLPLQICFSSWGTRGSLSWRSFSGKSGVFGRSSWIGEWSSEPWEAWQLQSLKNRWLTLPTYCFTRTLYEPTFFGICAIYFDLKVSDSPFFRGKKNLNPKIVGFFGSGNQAEKNPPQNQGCFVFVFQIGLFFGVWIFHCWKLPAIHLVELWGSWALRSWGGLIHGFLVGPVAVSLMKTYMMPGWHWLQKDGTWSFVFWNSLKSSRFWQMVALTVINTCFIQRVHYQEAWGYRTSPKQPWTPMNSFIPVP